jgi:4-hydroxybenzoate polyprenyltransferase
MASPDNLSPAMRNQPGPSSWVAKVLVLLEMIKIEHTVFALPFAFMGALLAARGLPTARQAFFILLAMVGARSAAMAFNRLVDWRYDALNPRTANRALPQGLISPRATIAFIIVSALLFFLAASQLNTLSLQLAPLALGVILFYSYTKRFTWASHLVLGASLAIAPAAGWIAVRSDIQGLPLLLSLTVLLWVSGFDILYSLVVSGEPMPCAWPPGCMLGPAWALLPWAGRPVWGDCISGPPSWPPSCCWQNTPCYHPRI